MRYVLLYESAPDVLETAPLHFEGHSARIAQFHAAGTLLMTGPFGDPVGEGSMSVFTTREAAEEFPREDPFVLNGVVAAWHVRDWDEALAGS